MEFQILGQVRVLDDGHPVDLGPTKNRSVFGILLLSAPRPVTVARLCDFLWDDPPAQARETLQSIISKLRRNLAEASLTVVIDYHKSTNSYCISGDVTHQVDYHRFRHLASQSVAALEAGDLAETLSLLEDARQLWCQPLLAELTTRVADTVRSSETTNQLLPAYFRLCATYLALGQSRDVLRLLDEIQPDHPLDESLAEFRLRALHLAGRAREINSYFRGFAHTVRVTNGTEPGAALTSVRDDLITGAPRDAAAEAPVLPQGFPRGPRTLVGRQALQAELDEIFFTHDDDLAPVVAMTGPPGIGKTATAVYWARRRQSHFAGDQLYIDLAEASGVPGRTACTVLATVLDYAGIRVSLETASDTPALVRHTRHALRRRHPLIVLDNATDTSALEPLLSALQSCPLLILSRTKLTTLLRHGDIAALHVPELAADDAIALVASRHPHLDPTSITMLVELCGGLPLALGIALDHLSSRPRVPAADIIGDLMSDPQRFLDTGAHADDARTLRRVFTTAFDTLPEDTRDLFLLLGLHPLSRISTAAAAALFGTDRPTAEHHLNVLNDRSLVTPERLDEYRVHDLIGVYARACARQLPIQHRSRAVHRMLAWYLHTAQHATNVLAQGREHLPPPPDAPVIPDIDTHRFATAEHVQQWYRRERDTLFRLIAMASDNGFPEYTWCLVASIREPFERLGNLQELIDLYDIGLRCARSAGDRGAEAGLLNDLATLHHRLGRLSDALHHAQATVALAHELGDHLMRVVTTHNLAAIQLEQGDIAHVIATLTANLVLVEQLGVPDYEAATHHRLGVAYHRIERYPAALRQLHLAATMRTQHGDDRGQAESFAELAKVHLTLNQLEPAMDYGTLALAAHTRAADESTICHTHAVLAEIHHRAGNAESAAQQAQAALIGLRELGALSLQARMLDVLASSHAALGRPEHAESTWDEAIALLRVLNSADVSDIEARRNALTEHLPRLPAARQEDTSPLPVDDLIPSDRAASQHVPPGRES